MSLAEIGTAGLLLAGAAWIWLRRPARALEQSYEMPLTAHGDRPATVRVDLVKMETLGGQLAERLWKVAFTVPGTVPAPVPGDELFIEPAHVRIRDSVIALLRADALDAKYLPRRPTLMPQLLRAVDDPGAASDRLARIVAHDPVLAADVLRLANSTLYRTSPAPIETIQRAIVILGVDALRGLLATAMLQPVFRATRNNFPRFPRMLWERTERAARAAELYSLRTFPQDRFEAQLVILLNALGPLVVYGTALDAYAQRTHVVPSPTLFVVLTSAMGARMSLKVARHWETSPRLMGAVSKSADEPLTEALCVGELLGTLSLLESQSVITVAEAFEFAREAGLAESITTDIWERIAAASVG